MSIYDELLRMQRIPDAYENWREYRRKLTDYIIASTDKNKTAAVFGAGSCNDIDIYRLHRHFSALTLVDRDCEIMKEGLERYRLKKKEDIFLVEKDFLGITDLEYRDYADDILKMIQVNGKNTNMKEVAEYAILAMEHLYKKAADRPLDFGEKKYDYVIVCGVNSQINNMFAWLWQVYCEAVGVMEDSVFSYVKEKNDEVQRRFLDALIFCAKEGMILGCEKERVGMEGAVQGAIQALRDIQIRQEGMECLMKDFVSLRWPFDESQGICYQMALLNIHFTK